MEINITQAIYGDCRGCLKERPDEQFDAVITDPPYEIGILGKQWDKTGIAFDVSVWREIHRVLKLGAYVAAFAATKTYHRLATAIEAAGFDIVDMIGWVSSHRMPKGGNLKPALEPIVIAKKRGNGKLNVDDCRVDIRGKSKPSFPVGEYATDSPMGNIRPTVRTGDSDPSTRYPSNVVVESDELFSEANFFYCARASSKEKQSYNTHPTVKPLELMKMLVKLLSPEGGRILDPFCGSGTTLVACRDLGRICIGFDNDKEAVDVATKRMAGKKWRG